MFLNNSKQHGCNNCEILAYQLTFVEVFVVFLSQNNEDVLTDL